MAVPREELNKIIKQGIEICRKETRGTVLPIVELLVFDDGDVGIVVVGASNVLPHVIIKFWKMFDAGFFLIHRFHNNGKPAGPSTIVDAAIVYLEDEDARELDMVTFLNQPDKSIPLIEHMILEFDVNMFPEVTKKEVKK